MINLIRTQSTDKAFEVLVRRLDEELKIRDGDDHLFYSQLNKTNSLNQVIVAYEDDLPVGCGALRAYTTDAMEVKRMYVSETHRGKRIATKILGELEKWAKELGFKKCILETGRNQPEAIGLYKKSGYASIANYGHYKEVTNSVCFEKELL